jgi:hypothetical protein
MTVQTSSAKQLGPSEVQPITDVISRDAASNTPDPCLRADSLASRLEEGARALAKLARSLTDEQWHARLPVDGRKVGVVVHHVAMVYPLEIELAQKLASGEPVTGVTMDDVHAMNASHAAEFSAVTMEAALDLLERNSAAAAASVRALSDDDLAQAAPVSLYGGAPLTCQFLLEDHAIRHSYHHLHGISQALRAQ